MLRIPSLRIMPGVQIAIAGENGAGKTSALTRIYDVDSGPSTSVAKTSERRP